MDFQHDPTAPTAPPSLTLPANFHFPYSDISAPRTPEPSEDRSSTPLQPDPPRIRIKRRRPGFNPHDPPQLQPGMAERIPSIELSESVPAKPTPLQQQDEAMLSPTIPSATFPRLVSPPRTPVSRVQPGFFDSVDWYSRIKSPETADITRPSSAFSQLSDSSSSYSSYSSSDTFTSVADSCLTPDTERKESLDAEWKSLPLASPVRLSQQSSRPHKHPKKHAEIRWTPEMDEHLWLTYMNYLSDPTVTPFKTLPGVPPPTGVCHRVAHAARKTWKGRRNRLSTVTEDGAPPFSSLDGTLMGRESSAPPVLGSQERSQSPTLWSHWPKESATRKHLRMLCKRKPSLSPHYQRLMRSRSPSPFESSSRGRVSSTPTMPSSSAFSTRDLNINLTTSTAASMQPSGPLAQLSSAASSSSAATAEHTPQRAAVPHQKSQSLQHDLDFAMSVDQPMQDARRLASPFHEPRRNTTSSPQPPLVNLAPKPASPLELHHPRPLSNSMKRRAQYPLGEEYITADPAARVEFLQNLFKDPEAAAGKRRVRSRGFSLGAMRHGQPPSRHISSLFTPPSTGELAPSSVEGVSDASASSKPTVQPLPTPSTGPGLAPPPSLSLFSGTTSDQHAAPRLGSPFSPTFGMSNTFPRNLFPLGLDSMAGVEHSRQPSSSSSLAQPAPSGKMRADEPDPFVVAPSSGPPAGDDAAHQHQHQHQRADPFTPGPAH